LHVTPVGSGNVARTERILISKRAEAAVIAWMRHQTTACDQMAIPRIKDKRREKGAASVSADACAASITGAKDREVV